MNNKNILIIALISILFSSCTVKSYYQVYKATTTDKLATKDKLLVYEDENCKVSYDLWNEGGNIGFQFYNKTDQNIYLNLEESFFILNGSSNNYYRSRVVTNSKSSGATAAKGIYASKNVLGITNAVGIMASSGFSVSYNEEKIAIIPAKTSKNISEYNINEALFRDCDLFKYPTKSQIKTKNFTKEQSPIVFSNRIAYARNLTDKLIKFENEFYVNQITNYPASEMFDSKNAEFCGEKEMLKTDFFKNVSADKFYIKYAKGVDAMKH